MTPEERFRMRLDEAAETLYRLGAGAAARDVVDTLRGEELPTIESLTRTIRAALRFANNKPHPGITPQFIVESLLANLRRREKRRGTSDA